MLNPVVIQPEEHPEYNFAELNRELDRAKSKVFLGSSAAFFGPLMCALDFVWATGLNTAANDGKTFWWDPKDFLRCDTDERVSTIMHELWHVARLHGLRGEGKCPDKWNIACDVLINREMIKSGYQHIKGPWWVVRPEFDHLETEEDIYNALPKNGGGGHSGNCQHGQIAVTPQVAQQMVNATVKAMQSAKMGGQPGSIPGNLEQVIEAYLAPKIPWETHLQRWMTDLLEDNYTWRRPNRRFQHVYLPSRFTDDGRLEHLIYYLDVSGSVDDDQVLRFNSEVAFIKRVYNPKKLTLVLFDTKITAEYVFEENDRFEKIVVIGRGGTSLGPVRQHILDNQPTAAIIFSDLYCTPMAPGPLCPIIWVAIGNTSAKVNMGKLIHISS
jgi:predicted metal-dependent peptidase